MTTFASSGKRHGVTRLATLADRHFGAFALGPILIFILLAALAPFLILVALSFTDFNFNLPGHSGGVIGLSNFHHALFGDPRLRASLGTQLKFLAATTPCEFLLGFWIAVQLQRAGKWISYLLPLLAVPLLLAPVTVGMLWRLLLHGDYGPIGYYVTRLPGLQNLSLLGDPRTALWAIAGVDIWQWTPFFVVVLYAGLHNLSRAPYMAALVDGASTGQIFRSITLPLLTPTITVALLIRFMDSFKEFDKIYVLTRGGPASTTELISVYTWIVSFDHGDLGYGSAITVLVYILIYFACAGMFRLLRNEWRVR